MTRLGEANIDPLLDALESAVRTTLGFVPNIVVVLVDPATGEARTLALSNWPAVSFIRLALEGALANEQRMHPEPPGPVN